MRAYLMRHGEAVESSVDPRRPLSDVGREDVGKIAAYMSERGLRVAEIWHSPKERARETAQIVRELGGFANSCEETAGLLPGDDVAGIAQRIESATEDCCVVGHLPYLAYLAGHLLEGAAAAPSVSFGTATMVCLERGASGVWAVLWVVSPSEV